MSQPKRKNIIQSALSEEISMNSGRECLDISDVFGKAMDQIPADTLDHILLCQECMSLYRLMSDSPPLHHIPDPNWYSLDLRVRSCLLWGWFRNGLDERIRDIQEILSCEGKGLSPVPLRKFGKTGQTALLKFDPDTFQIPELLPDVSLVNLTGKNLQETHLNPSLRLSEDPDRGIIVFSNLDYVLQGHEAYLLSISEIELRLLTGSDCREDSITKIRDFAVMFHEKPSPSIQKFFRDLFIQSFVMKSSVFPDPKPETDTAIVEFEVTIHQLPNQLQSSRIWILVLGQLSQI